MKNLSIEKMEEINGNGSNADNAMCVLATAAFALGPLTAMSGLGLVLWAVGGVGVVYCSSQMADSKYN